MLVLTYKAFMVVFYNQFWGNPLNLPGRDLCKSDTLGRFKGLKKEGAAFVCNANNVEKLFFTGLSKALEDKAVLESFL